MLFSNKKYLFTLFVFLSIFNNNIFSQNLSGKFFDETDFLFFNDKNISFSVQSNGGLITVLKGNGEYQIIDDFLIIKTKESKFEKSKINTVKTSENIQVVKVEDVIHEPVAGASVSLLSSKNKIIAGELTDKSGIAHIKTSDKAKKIHISCIGYDELTADYFPDVNYTVMLTNYETPENKTLVFKIYDINSDKISLQLLSEDFKSKINKYNLNKLYRKTKKYKFRIRTFIFDK